MDKEELTQQLKVRGYLVDDLGPLYCYGPTLNLKINYIAPGKGVIEVSIRAHFNKWGDSRDAVCYGVPKTTPQLDRFLDEVIRLCQNGSLLEEQGLDITYLLRKVRRQHNSRRKRKAPHKERKKSKVLNQYRHTK